MTELERLQQQFRDYVDGNGLSLRGLAKRHEIHFAVLHRFYCGKHPRCLTSTLEDVARAMGKKFKMEFVEE